MDTKLTDFTADQLHKLLVAVVAEQEFRTTVEGIEDEDLRLFQVQILNAQSTVRDRETTQAN